MDLKKAKHELQKLQELHDLVDDVVGELKAHPQQGGPIGSAIHHFTNGTANLRQRIQGVKQFIADKEKPLAEAKAKAEAEAKADAADKAKLEAALEAAKTQTPPVIPPAGDNKQSPEGGAAQA